MKKQLNGSEADMIDGFIENGDDSNEYTTEEEVCDSKDWLSLIDRRGLTKCTNEFYTFVCAVKLELKSVLHDKSLQSCGSLGHPKEISYLLLNKRSIVDCWSNIFTAQLDDTEYLLSSSTLEKTS